MAKYEAVISVTIEVEADSSDSADQLIFGEFTDRLLDTASRDNTFKLWSEVLDIEELADEEND